MAGSQGTALAIQVGQAGDPGWLPAAMPGATALRAALQTAAGNHTALTRLFIGGAARGIGNRLMPDRGPLSALAPPFPPASLALAPLWASAGALEPGDFRRCGAFRIRVDGVRSALPS